MVKVDPLANSSRLNNIIVCEREKRDQKQV